MRSTMSLSDWVGNWTLFNGFYNTRPAGEFSGPFMHFVANIASEDGPALIADKERCVYFIPCHLKNELLIGNTRTQAERKGLPLIGKQRSAQHVTESRMIVVDLDGISGKKFKEILRGIAEAGLTFLAYSSHSHGKVNKPGVRSRLIVPIDEPLNSADYKQAAIGLNALLLQGLADPSGFALYQQQGVWATAPERAEKAFRIIHRAGVARASTLIDAAPKRAVSQVVEPRQDGLVDCDSTRLRDALQWIDPETYTSWINCAIWLKAAYGDAAYPLWVAWGELASEEAKAGNDGKYAPEKVWAGLEPRITAEQGAGALFAHAREGALVVAKKAELEGVWGEGAKRALVYLRKYHRKFFEECFKWALLR